MRCNFALAYLRFAVASFDFTHFEDVLFPQWQALFVSGDAGSGEYSYKAHHATSVYGVTDMIYALHAAGQLGSLPKATRLRWADTINRFQNHSTGFYEVQDFEQVHVANPPFANFTWHGSGAAVETLKLLSDAGGDGEAISPPLEPPIVFAAVDEMLAAGPVVWAEFVDHWLTGYDDVWRGSQAVQSLAALVKLTKSRHRPESEPFGEWLLTSLNASISPDTGMWDGTPPQDKKHQLGGAFHIYHVYQCYLGEAAAAGGSWSPHARAAVNTTLAAQHSGPDKAGIWGKVEKWSERDQWGAISTCIDLDGVYTAARAALAVAAQDGGAPYRWADVEQACRDYLQVAEFLLNNETFVLDKYAKNTHVLHGPMYAVAECQLHFPDLVATRRPWRRWTDASSCIYAAEVAV